ncbi:MAG: phytanoyl-CoA dioxygenase family protein [Thermoflexibacter sp.]|jgi:ectoine hydroxylase-related dioxygenase (phytanoyl-CoA dioxygenase family)|nr:phytanoyl-CoA dioxygenase family protein [Thermoflexibacter sp.]
MNHSFTQEQLTGFASEIHKQGYTIIPDILAPDFIKEAKTALEKAIQAEVEYHKTTNYSDYGMVLLCSLYDKIFIELFDNPKLVGVFNAVLGEGCIVYAYTSSSMPPNKTNYSRRIHVDCPRIIPNYITNMGATILLDDFTEENGATYFLPYSQNRETVPTEEEFYGKGKRVIAKAGSVWFFNARVWHAGGDNLTQDWRHALTINMCRSWMKQRIDIPRAMSGIDMSGVSDQAKQKLGFFTQIPANYEEYYAPAELRKYKQKTE